jgi:hypothetical protein
MMRKDEVFDNVTRILASGMSRRRVLKLTMTSLAAAVLGRVSLKQAWALPCATGLVPCPNSLFCCPTQAQCAPGGCCATGLVPCPNSLFCCAPGQCNPNGGCCPPPPACSASCPCTSGTCVNNICCAPDECCPACTGTDVCQSGTCVPMCSPCSSTNATVKALLAGPPTQLQMAVQNATYGIAKITVATATNCTVAPFMPMATGGTKNPIGVTATKTDQTQVARIVLGVFAPEDSCPMCPMDPIFTVLKLATGQWVRQTFANIAQTDRFLTVTNGDPGMERLEIWINSRLYRTVALKENETSSLDLAAAMTETENSISFVGYGELGASANIMVVDTAPATDANSGSAPAVQEQGLVHRHSPIWGPLAEETEENSDLHTADAMSQTVRLNFNGALNSTAALDPSIFTIEVNRKAVMVGTVQTQASATGGLDLTLQLPTETLHSGDIVDVYWQNMRDLKERLLSGHVPLLVQ